MNLGCFYCKWRCSTPPLFPSRYTRFPAKFFEVRPMFPFDYSFQAIKPVDYEL